MRDSDITVPVQDYGIQRRDKPSVRMVSYEELKSGLIDLGGKEVSCSPLSSFQMAREVAANTKRAGGTGRVPAQPDGRTPIPGGKLPAHEADQGVAQCG